MAWSKLDRVMAALSGEKPDRTPIFDYMINDRVYEHYLGRPVVPEEKEAILYACSQCLDLCHPMPVARAPCEEILPDGTRRLHERWMHWDIHPKRSEEEMFKALAAEVDELESGESRPSGEHVAAWKEDEARKTAWAGNMAYISLGLSNPILPGRNIVENAFYFADCPDLCRKWNKLKNQQGLEWADAISTGCKTPVAIIWDDIAMKGGPIFSPELLDELYFPRLHDMVSMLHSKGIKTVFHSDGDVSPVFNRLADCGIDGFNPLEISAGMNVNQFVEQYGKKVSLVGGLDAVDVLAFGTPASVTEATRQLIRDAGTKTGGRLIIGSSSGQIDNSMPFENLIAYFNTVWETKI